MKRRNATIGIIGTIAGSLFGLLTENDGEYYNNEIDKLYAGLQNLSLLMVQQTHLVQSKL